MIFIDAYSHNRLFMLFLRQPLQLQVSSTTKWQAVRPTPARLLSCDNDISFLSFLKEYKGRQYAH